MKLEYSHKLIIDNVNRFIDLTELEKRKYLSLLTEIKVKKKAFLMQAGEITRYEYFKLNIVIAILVMQ